MTVLLVAFITAMPFWIMAPIVALIVVYCFGDQSYHKPKSSSWDGDKSLWRKEDL